MKKNKIDLKTSLDEYFKEHSSEHPLKEVINRVIDNSHQPSFEVEISEKEFLLLEKPGVNEIVTKILCEIGVDFVSCGVSEEKTTFYIVFK